VLFNIHFHKIRLSAILSTIYFLHWYELQRHTIFPHVGAGYEIAGASRKGGKLTPAARGATRTGI